VLLIDHLLKQVEGSEDQVSDKDDQKSPIIKPLTPAEQNLFNLINAQNKQGNTFLHLFLLKNHPVASYDKLRSILTTRFLSDDLCNHSGFTSLDLSRQAKEAQFLA
jgi:hypothetical protein